MKIRPPRRLPDWIPDWALRVIYWPWMAWYGVKVRYWVWRLRRLLSPRVSLADRVRTAWLAFLLSLVALSVGIFLATLAVEAGYFSF